MNYQLLLKKHLAVYKRSDLGIDEDGIFKHRGRNVACEHILPVHQAWRNLLPAALQHGKEFLAKHPKKRHRHFHHLNSSQAFAFNLFFPYFHGGPEASAALLKALGQGGGLRSWEPEAIPDREEGTNLDATWLTEDGTRTFCEVKLSENGLGKAKADPKHLGKLKDLYRPKLEGYCDPELLEVAAFFPCYQFARNVWHMAGDENSRLVFLAPRANRAVWSALEVLIPRVAELHRARISRVAVEDVLTALSVDEHGPPELRLHAASMIRKYIPSC